MSSLPAYISALYPNLFVLQDGVSVRRSKRQRWSNRIEAIDSFLDTRVDEGDVIVQRVGQKRRKPSRKEREMAAGPGWTQEQLRSHFGQYGSICLKCGTKENIVPDHVIPLCRGGAHHLNNIQPLCKDCNFVKGITIIDYRSKANPLLNLVCIKPFESHCMNHV